MEKIKLIYAILSSENGQIELNVSEYTRIESASSLAYQSFRKINRIPFFFFLFIIS